MLLLTKHQPAAAEANCVPRKQLTRQHVKDDKPPPVRMQILKCACLFQSCPVRGSRHIWLTACWDWCCWCQQHPATVSAGYAAGAIHIRP